MDVKRFMLGVLVGYLASLFVPLRLSVSGLGAFPGQSPRSDRPPGMTGGGPGNVNNPGM